MSIGDFFDALIQNLPVPKTVFETVWSAIGWQLGSAFSKTDNNGLDETIVKYGKFTGFTKFLVERLLHFVHHYWIGGLGVIYFGVAPIAQTLNLPIQIPNAPNAELFWLCLGLTLEDTFYHLKESAKDGKIAKLTGR